MKEKLKRLLGIMLLFGGLHTAQAEDLLEVYDIARQNDAQLQAAEAAYLAALQARPKALAPLLPQIGFSADTSTGRQKVSDSSSGFIPNNTYDTDSTNYGLRLNQSLYNHQYWVQLSQADHSIAQAEAEVMAARQALVLRVAEAYFNVLGAEDNLEFAKSEREAIGRQLEQTQKRFEVGLIAITDVKESQASYDQAVAQEIQAVNLLDNNRENLEVITGLPIENLGKLTERMELVSPDPEDMDAWVDTALEQNLPLIAARFASESAHDEVRRQRAGHYPTLDLFASAGSGETDGSFGSRTTDDTSIGIQANVPIYTGGSVSALTREARHNFEQAQRQLEFQRRDTVRQTRASYLNVLADISSVRAFHRALESTQTAAEATQAGFEVGTRTSVDVLLTLRNVFQAERDYARSRYNYVLNSLRLKQAAGTLGAEDVQAVNQWLD